MTFKTNKMSVFLTTAFLFLLPSIGYSQKVGFESEFATVGFMEPQWGEKQLALSKTMLEIVQGHFEGKGEIQTVPWSKYTEKNLKIMIYKDPLGRTWSVDPESVNTSGLDGVEFVTPALESPEDFERYSKILRSFRQSKLLMRGLRSSNHVTVDVSHLTQDPNNISKLVDLILTIENHWAEIYRFYDPVRYGTIINRFSVPLALDQQDLLKELAALPENQRSYNNVRNIFMKYDEKENFLRNADGSNPVRKWKYRAANYGKLFRLAPDAKGISAIEFRIGDLDFGSRVDEKADFMRKLVTSNHLDKTFTSPFGDKVLDWKQGTEVLKKSPLRTDFLRDLVDDKKLASIERKDERKSAANTLDVELVDMNRAVEKDGKYITFGFEAEFKDGANARKVVSEDRSAPSSNYSYLDSRVSIEGTGNIEVRSIGGERVLAEVLEQMNTIRSALREDLRGFHMHMRIPAEMIAQHDPEVLKAWMTNISDAVFAWRLQNRRHFLALKTVTLARQEVETIEVRGPVRLTRLADGTWDFEIRGYMNSSEMIGMMAQKVMTGIVNPEFIKTLIQEQKYIQIQAMTLIDGLESYNKIFFKRSLSAEEKAIVQKLMGEVVGRGMLPLYDFAKIFDYDPVTKRKIQDATMTFFKETSTVIRNQLSGKYSSDQELSKQFRWRIKRWAQAVDLQSLLEKRILSSSVSKDGSPVKTMYKYNREEHLKEITTNRTLTTLENAIRDSNRFVRANAFAALRGRTDEKSWTLIEKALGDSESSVRANAAIALQGRTDTKSLALIENALGDLDSSVRANAVIALQSRADTKSFALIEKALGDSESSVRANAIVALGGRTDAKSLSLIEKALGDPERSVRSNAVIALRGRTDEKSLALIKKAFGDSDLSVRANAGIALQDRRDEGSLSLIEKALGDSVSSVRSNAVIALRGRTDEKSLALIERALGDSDDFIRDQAIVALGGRTDAKSLSLIEKTLGDSNGWSRATAVAALGGRTDLKSLSLIEKALGDSEDVVRKKAISTLLSRTDVDIVSSLEKCLSEVGDKNDSREVILKALISKVDNEKFLALYSKELNNPNTSGVYTELKRSYILRFGSLNAKPTRAARCERVFN